MKKFDTIIVGAGASGLMVANRYNSDDIAIIEANEKVAKKIKISGGGRCNITNKILSFRNYVGDKNFVKDILDGFTQYDLLNFFKVRNVTPVIKKDTQYFCKNSSSEIIDALMKDIKNIPIFYNQQVQNIEKRDGTFFIKTQKDEFRSKKLIIASGGLSFTSIGASDLAFRTAESFGHKIAKLKPALLGFTLQKEQFWMKELSGISLPVCINLDQKKIKGDLLFAHKGISGPAILNASLYWEKGNIDIDFIPNQKLDQKFFKSNKKISTALKVPKRFAKAFLDHVDLSDLPLSELSLDQREKLLKIKSYSFAPAGNFGYTKAEVTKGGVCTDEIDCKTMMSKKCENLYFLGECLDVTGELGGYNFQWAFATAWRLNLHKG